MSPAIPSTGDGRTEPMSPAPGRLVSAPMVLIIFRRPQTTARVFEVIRQARPAKLLVVADGPRRDRPGEAEACAAARAATDGVDWPCEVLRSYSEENLGLKRRVSTGLDWAFRNVPEAIILEDDVLPHPSFFRFCTELLDRYRDDQRIMTICGNNYPSLEQSEPHSYYFSRIFRSCGWATWNRAWAHHDMELRAWPELRSTRWLPDLLGDEHQVRQWARNFDKIYENRKDVWSWGWTFAIWVQNGVIVAPHGNLISNIGYGGDASNSTKVDDPHANAPTHPVSFPLRHPTHIIRNREADDFRFRAFYGPPKKPWALRKISRLLGKDAT